MGEDHWLALDEDDISRGDNDEIISDRLASGVLNAQPMQALQEMETA